uniref:Zinc finger DNA binding protein n=1 Tax=Heliothis virescens TaxID=7102 RepID=A0A2A4JL66_HELVI
MRLLQQRVIIWKAEHDAILSGLTNDISDLKIQCSQIRESHLEIDRSVKFVNTCYEEIKNKFDEIQKLRKENDDRTVQLEQYIQDLQLQSRPATIELRNVPQKTKETADDLVAVVSAIGKVVDIAIEPSNLRDLYRLPGISGTPRPIVAEFISVPKRNEFLSNVRRYNKERPITDKLNTASIGVPGDKKPIYVDEHLPPSKKKLFYDARTFAKANKFSCWNSHGRILLRRDSNDLNEKPIQIKSAKCILALTKKQ